MSLPSVPTEGITGETKGLIAMDDNLKKLFGLTAWFNINKTSEKTSQIADQNEKILKELREANRHNESFSQSCPTCKGGVKSGAELCMHCNNPMIWVHGKVGKPGEEGRLKREFESQRRGAQKRVDKWLLPDEEWQEQRDLDEQLARQKLTRIIIINVIAWILAIVGFFIFIQLY